MDEKQNKIVRYILIYHGAPSSTTYYVKKEGRYHLVTRNWAEAIHFHTVTDARNYIKSNFVTISDFSIGLMMSEDGNKINEIKAIK